MTKRKEHAVCIPFIVGLVLLSACNKKQIPVQRIDKEEKKQALYTNLEETYAPMIKLAQAINYPSNKQEFNNQIMLHNDLHNKKKSKNLFGAPYQDLPFVQYKNLLDKRIKQLQRYIRKLRKKKNNQDKNYENKITKLISQLEDLNRVTITSEEYRQEKLKLADKKSGSWGILSFVGSLVSKVIPT